MSIYYTQCTKLAEEIIAGRISPFNPNEALIFRDSGSTAVFYSLGNHALGDLGVLPVGLKIGRERRSLRNRYHREMAYYSLMSDPRFLPAFHIPVDLGDGKIAILTEDLSDNGENTVSPTGASYKLRKALYEPFKKFGNFDDIIDSVPCNESVAFLVTKPDGTNCEKALDLSPMPLRQGWHEFPNLEEELMRSKEIPQIRAPEGWLRER